MPGEATIEAQVAEPVVSLMDAPPAAEPVVEDKPAAEEPVVEDKPVVEETPEEKAAREAAESPEDKATREAEEARRAALTDEERAAEDEAAATKAEREAGAPETYADFKLPEGVTLDTETLDSFKAFAKEDNLSQGAAQRYIDTAIGLQNKWTTQATEAFAAEANGWREATMKDPEFGGPKLAETLAGAKAVRDKFGDDDLKAVLDQFRLGDHPAVVRFFDKVAKATGEDKLVVQGKAGGDKSAAELLFPSMKK